MYDFKKIAPTIEKVQALQRELGAPPYTCIIVGSKVLELLGIRAGQDIDLSVPELVFDKLQHRGWRAEVGEGDRPVLRHDNFDVGVGWNGWTHEEIRVNCFNGFGVDGVAFASLGKVLDWKLKSNRPKDAADWRLVLSYAARLEREVVTGQKIRFLFALHHFDEYLQAEES